MKFMPGFLDKSQINIHAAEVLQKNHNYFVSSIHCSYYACIQHMLHIVFNKLNVTKQQFDTEKRNNKDGTHGWASKRIEIELAHIDRQEFKWFQKAFPELKQLREDADYSENIAGIDSSRDALNKANEIIRTLNKHFK